MNKKVKVFSACLTAALLALCVAGLLAFNAGTASYTRTYQVGTDGATISAVLAKAAGETWDSGQSICIEFSGTQSAGSGPVAFAQKTIFRTDGTKLPITLKGNGAASSTVELPAAAKIACANDYIFENLTLTVPNDAYFFAGSANVTLKAVSFGSTGFVTADNHTARSYEGWTADNIALATVDGKVESSLTLLEGTAYTTGNKLGCSAYLDTAPTEGNYQTLGFDDAASYSIAPKISQTRAKLVIDPQSTAKTFGVVRAKYNYSPCDAELIVKSGQMNTSINNFYMTLKTDAMMFGNFKIHLAGGNIAGIRGANTTTFHDKVEVVIGTENGETAPVFTGVVQAMNGSPSVYGGAFFTIYGGTFPGTVYGVMAPKGCESKNTIHGGTFKADKSFFSSFTSSARDNSTAITTEVTGGTFSGIFTGTPSNQLNSAILDVEINLTVSGGTFNGLYKGNDSGISLEGRTVKVTHNISGGTFNNVVYGGGANLLNATVTNNISGGTFTKNVFGGGVSSATIKGDSAIVNNISGGTFQSNFYGGNEKGVLEGNITNNVSSGTFQGLYVGGNLGGDAANIINNVSGDATFGGTRWYGGSYGTTASTAATDAIVGNVTNNISGGTFNSSYTIGGGHGGTGSYYYAQVNGTITNVLTGGTFQSFVAGNEITGGAHLNQKTDVIRNTVSGDVNIVNNFYGGHTGAPIPVDIQTTVSGGTIRFFFGAGGTNTSCSATGTITNTILGGEIGTFTGGSNNGYAPAAITNNVYGGTITSNYIAGSKTGSDSETIVSNVYGGTFAKVFIGDTTPSASPANVPALNLFAATSAVTQEGADPACLITFGGAIAEDANAVVNVNGGDKAIQLGANGQAWFTSVSGDVTVKQIEEWKPSTTYLTVPTAFADQITVTKSDTASGAVNKTVSGANTIWKSPAGITPGTVTIPDDSYAGDSDLVSITIPSSVTTIGAGAFANCPNLVEVKLSDSVTTIGAGAFAGSPVTRLIFADGTVRIKTELVAPFAATVEETIIPNSVTTIDEDAFNGCAALTAINLGNGTQKIGQNAFANTAFYQDAANWTGDALILGDALLRVKASAPASFTVPAGVRIIADGAFSGCTALTSVTLGQDLTVVNAEAFAGSAVSEIVLASGTTTVTNAMMTPFSGFVQSVVMPDSVTTIQTNAFADCAALNAATIGTGIQRIEKNAFAGTALYNDPANWTEQALYIGSNLIAVKTEKAGEAAILPGTALIADSAFENCSAITSLVIPTGLTTIGDGAFSGCTALATVTMPDSVTSVGPTTFAGCPVTKLILAEGATTVTATALSAFADVLEEVVIPNTVTTIDDNAFSGRTALTTVNVPASVTTIGQGAFSGCTQLASINVGKGVTTIGQGAYGGCTGVTTITVDPENAVYHNAGDCLIETETKILLAGCPASVIPTDGSVTSIGDSAFSGYTSITAIVIPSSITTIGNNAFNGCTSLSDLTLPGEIGGMGTDAFSGCPITSLTIADGSTAVTGAATAPFAANLTSVTVPETVTRYENGAFQNVPNLTSIPMPSGLTYIGNNVFTSCPGVTSLTIPAGVTTIGAGAFSGCTGLTDLTLSDGSMTVDATAFASCPITSLTVADGSTKLSATTVAPFAATLTSISLADSVTSYDSDAFANCAALTTVDFGNGVSQIWGNTFYGRTGLTNVVFGTGLRSIDSYAFSGCTGLVDLVLPEGLTGIGQEAFSGCTGLATVTIPATLTSIGQNAFKGCTGLTAVSISDLASWSQIRFASLYANPLYYAGNLVLGGEPVTALGIPASVTEISNYAFAGLNSITALNLSKGIQKIGLYAFSGCDSVTSVSYGGTVQEWEKVEVLEGNDPPLNTAAMTFNILPGDLDDDGAVTDWDAVLMDRYLAGWTVTVNMAALDFDQDGVVTDWDGVLLDRYLAGWDITPFLGV